MAVSFKSKGLLAIGMSVAMVLGAAAIWPSSAGAQNAPAAAAAPTSMPAQPLDKNMQAMSRAYRALKPNVADKSKNDATLASLSLMQQATLAAKVQMPTKLGDLAGDEKAKKMLEYRVMIVKLLQSEFQLEAAILAGDTDKTADIIKTIDDTQKAGHAEFRQ